MDNYSINNIAFYRKIDWRLSDDFFYLTDIPVSFEPFVIHPDYYSYGILSAGSIVIEIDNCCHYISTQSFMVYRPEQKFRIISIEPGTKGAFILFTRRFISDSKSFSDCPIVDSFLNRSFGSHILVKPQDHHSLSVIFHKIFDILSHIGQERWETSAKNLVKALINETDLLLRNYKPTVHEFYNKETNIIIRFKKLAKDNFMTQRRIDFYADKLNISKSHLFKIMKRQNQQTPSSYLNALVIDEAKILLLHSESTVGEIAEKLSFSNIYSFSKFFKSHTTVSPLQFRTQLSSLDRNGQILNING